jgi:hypothetical protein
MPASYVGGEDYSFEYPYVLGASERSSPYCDITQSRCSFAYLHENDVDVYKFEIAEGQTGFPIFGAGPTRQYIALAAYPPACCPYKDFYPIIGLFGPGLPEIEEELPFKLPEDCEDCGMIRTHPTKAECGERPIFTIITPRYSWFFSVDIETDNIWWEPDPSSPDGGIEPGTYYAVVWEENGVAGEYSGVLGFDEYDDEFNRLQVAINVPLVDDMKTTHVKCEIARGPDPFNPGSYTGTADCCDDDNDGVSNGMDNCPEEYNPDQKDNYPPQTNSCGDACECEGDFDSDGDVDLSDRITFSRNFGRNNCTEEDPCNGDLNCDGKVNLVDRNIFISDFGRTDCPYFPTDPWCIY